MLETLYNPDDTEERCGLVLVDGTLVEVENIAEDKANSYVMNPSAVLPFLIAGAITGTWHTHVNDDPNLSGEDHEGFRAWPDLDHFIIGLRAGHPCVVKYRFDRGVLVVCD